MKLLDYQDSLRIRSNSFGNRRVSGRNVLKT